MLESGTEKRTMPFQLITWKEGFFNNALIFYLLIFNTTSFPGYLNSFNSLFQGWSIQSKSTLRGSQTITQDKKKEEWQGSPKVLQPQRQSKLYREQNINKTRQE